MLERDSLQAQQLVDGTVLLTKSILTFRKNVAGFQKPHEVLVNQPLEGPAQTVGQYNRAIVAGIGSALAPLWYGYYGFPPGWREVPRQPDVIADMQQSPQAFQTVNASGTKNEPDRDRPLNREPCEGSPSAPLCRTAGWKFRDYPSGS